LAASSPPSPTLGTQALAPDFSPPLLPSAAWADQTAGRWVQWAHLRVRYSFTYSDGALARPGEQDATITQTVAPGIDIRLSDRWFVSYTPSITFYSSDRFRDGVDHMVSLTGSFDWSGWIFGIGQTAGWLSSRTFVETGAQTDQQSYGTSLSAGRALSSKVSLDLGLQQNIRLAAGFTDIWSWSSSNWLNYHPAPRFSYGPGIILGYTMVEPGTDMTFEQFQGRVNWQATDKLSFSVNGGVEIRQLLDTGLSDLVNPLFGASVQWRPFEVTTLSFHANHSINASYFSDQVTQNTTLGGSLNQRLLKKLALSVSAGYRTADYLAAAVGVGGVRQDETFYYNVRLSTRFLKNGTIGAFFGHTENLSNEADFAFDDNRAGFDIGYRW
jgi:hypothetical protein